MTSIVRRLGVARELTRAVGVVADNMTISDGAHASARGVHTSDSLAISDAARRTLGVGVAAFDSFAISDSA